MAVPNQRVYPRVSKIGQISPIVSQSVTIDHRAYIHPIQSYKWMHNLYLAAQELLNISMPEEQRPRFELTEDFRFIEDCSGRSTGKTFDYLAILAVRSVAVPDYAMVWLGQNVPIGHEVFEKFFGAWIEKTDFGRFVRPKGRKDPRVSEKSDGARLELYNRSTIKSMSPDPKKGYKKMQSMRYNDGIINEWTSLPKIRKLPEIVGPIFTNTNMPWTVSKQFREAMEEITGVRLGRLTDEDLKTRHKKPNYVPRPNLGKKLKPWGKVQELFYYNFEAAFGFDYKYGVEDEDLKFKPIKKMGDITEFFADYADGDMVYSNKLIYDGSAKRPSDDSHWLHRLFMKRSKVPKSLYAQFTMSVDDLGDEWDGVIYDSAMIDDYREDNLDEDFQRVYGGQWLEGRVQNPFLWQDIVSCCEKEYVGLTERLSPDQEFIGGIDSAQGTDATYKTDRGALKDARGDDGAAYVFEVAGGTPESPHKLCLGDIAEDVRSESWAFQIQKIEQAFQGDNSIGCEWWMVDPGGGGKATIERLADFSLSMVESDGTEVIEDFMPMVPWDHENPTGKKNTLVLFSLSNEMIQQAFVAHSKSEKAALQYADQLNNYLVVIFQRAIRRRAVVFPELVPPNELTAMFNNDEISSTEYKNRLFIYEGLQQIAMMRYVLDNDGKKEKTTRGVFKYQGSGKKDAAMTILYGYLMCEIHVILNKKLKGNDDESQDGDKLPSDYPALGQRH